MSDVSAVHDLVFHFVAFRRHSFSFYREFHSDHQEIEQFGGPYPPMLQQARLGQVQIDRLGRSISEQLRVHCRAITCRTGIFQYVAHRPFVRSGHVLVHLEYTSPAIPHLTVLASVCRAWNLSDITWWISDDCNYSHSNGTLSAIGHMAPGTIALLIMRSRYTRCGCWLFEARCSDVRSKSSCMCVHQ